MPTKVYIQPHPLFYGKVMWFFYLVQSVRKIEFEFIPVKEEAIISVGESNSYDIIVSTQFYDKLSLEMFDHSVFFDETLMIFTEDGQEDIISTVFYLINCIQEYNADKMYLDQYGRFKKEMSLQHKFRVEEKNLVVVLIDKFIEKVNLTNGVVASSKVYISHDIDFLTSGFRQEFMWALSKGNFVKAFDFIKERIAKDSPWNNIDDIIDLDKSMNIASTFYWLNYNVSGMEGVQNADYILKEEWLQKVKDNGLINGLHKSATDYSMRKEVGDFPEDVLHNRYHFLKFKLPYAWNDLQSSKVKTDASLGFSRGMGFRNSFGLPFYPYNLSNEMPYRTLIIPLQIMEVGLKSYASGNRHEVVKEVMDFIDRNRTDCLISLLFHNNELTPYSNKYMLEAYKDIIDIIKESGLEIIGIDRVLEEYG